ncbi:MAG: hypothetical protein RSB57_01890 [Hungatella sp.]
MNKKYILTCALSLTLMLVSVVPTFAGTWIEQDNNTWEYQNDDGEYVTGWIDDGTNRYYLDEDGVKKTGWFKSKGCWYYLDEDGILASSTWIDNYYVNADGKWIKTK